MDVPDASLNEEDLKEKRKQKMMKGGFDARVRARAEKESAKILALEEKNRDEAKRLADPEEWLRGIQSDYNVRDLSLNGESWLMSCSIGFIE